MKSWFEDINSAHAWVEYGAQSLMSFVGSALARVYLHPQEFA